MKRYQKFIAAVLTVLLVATCFAACGKGPERDKDLVGTWVTTLELPIDVDIEVGMDMVIEFDEDGTMEIYVPDKAIREASEQTYEQVYGAYSDEDVAAALEELGYESAEDCIEDLYQELKETMEESHVKAIWTTHDGQIITYDSEEDFKDNKPSEDGADDYKISKDGEKLTIGEGSEKLVFEKD